MNLQEHRLDHYRKALRINPHAESFALHCLHYELKATFVKYATRKYNSTSRKSLYDSIKSWINYCQESPTRSDIHLKTLGHLYTYIGNFTKANSYYQFLNYKQNKKKYKKRYNSLDQIQELQSKSNPNFIIIGAGKAGSTSLYSWLTKHPSVLQALDKEVQFFRKDFYLLGEKWYSQQFPITPKNSDFITGEATPWYLFESGVASRISRHCPEVRLIVLLRNPVRRALSQYKMFYKQGIDSRNFLNAVSSERKHLENFTLDSVCSNHFLDQDYWIDEKGYLLYGLYAHLLYPWLQEFPREQILILKSEDFFSDPQSNLDSVFAYLGLPKYTLSEYKNSNLNQYSPMNSELYKTLSDFYEPHNQMLEEMLGVRFNWD